MSMEEANKEVSEKVWRGSFCSSHTKLFGKWTHSCLCSWSFRCNKIVQVFLSWLLCLVRSSAKIWILLWQSQVHIIHCARLVCLLEVGIAFAVCSFPLMGEVLKFQEFRKSIFLDCWVIENSPSICYWQEERASLVLIWQHAKTVVP
jgi:hypothetical protein